MGLLFSADYLKVDEAGIDQAFYIEGSWVILSWKVENAWLIRVNHPGGFYGGSDKTWFVARQGMEPIRLTIYGTKKVLRYEFPVRVKAWGRKAAAYGHLNAQLKVEALDRGPRLKPKAEVIRQGKARFRHEYLNGAWRQFAAAPLTDNESSLPSSEFTPPHG